MLIGDAAMLKMYRRLREGEQPEIEVARFLTEVAGYKNTPPFFGSVEYRPKDAEPMGLAAVFGFVRNQGDAWTVTLDALERHLDEFAFMPPVDPAAPPVPDGPLPSPAAADFAYPLNLGAILGQRTGELHAAFAVRTDNPDFAAEPIGKADLDSLGRAYARGDGSRARHDRERAFDAPRRRARRRGSAHSGARRA